MLPPIEVLPLLLQAHGPFFGAGLPHGPILDSVPSMVVGASRLEPPNPPPGLFGVAASPVSRSPVTSRWMNAIREAQTKSSKKSRHDFHAYRTILDAARDEPVPLQISIVQGMVNHLLRYREDARLWPGGEYWATPAETLSWRAGDCEDYAILKYALLRDLGFPDSALRVVAVSTKDGDHAVLAVRHEDEWLIQDNRFALTQLESSLTHYTPLFSVNAATTWNHRPHSEWMPPLPMTYGEGSSVALPSMAAEVSLFQEVEHVRSVAKGNTCSQALAKAIKRVDTHRKRRGLEVMASYIDEAGNPVGSVPCEILGSKRRVQVIAVAMTPGREDAFGSMPSTRLVDLTNILRQREQRIVSTRVGATVPNRTRALRPATLHNVQASTREGVLVLRLDTDTIDALDPNRTPAERGLTLFREFTATRAKAYAQTLRQMPEFGAAALEIRSVSGFDTPEEHWRFELEAAALLEFEGGHLDSAELLERSEVFLDGVEVLLQRL